MQNEHISLRNECKDILFPSGGFLKARGGSKEHTPTNLNLSPL